MYLLKEVDCDLSYKFGSLMIVMVFCRIRILNIDILVDIMSWVYFEC